ncbi:VOC family virulence protein [Maritimibacter sp. 55A14]|uniref:VOC family protein n=1 Tax=Maritimibacter sp. 55A14 TaxID=2174844 RepID=UPI000D60943C|nr:VOC family protein [Maritimibacter sp. 55A14]PWE32401.1 VOC family virulence protein [Maritimibacter sp. 55A14]
MEPALRSLDHLVLTVADIPRSVAFYTSVLGMEAESFRPSDGSTRTALTFGSQKINLHEAGREFEPKAAAPAPGSADLCFLSGVPLSRWLEHLERHCIAIEEGPVARSGATGPITSIYIRDPDGNLIEISEPA